MKLGVTLKTAEKVFGPALPGKGTEEKTLSAVWYAAGKGEKSAGVLGFQKNAQFHIHFPKPIDWNLLTTEKGTPDFVNDLKISGPQGEQGRQIKVEQFLRDEKATNLRARLSSFLGTQAATLTLGSEPIPLSVTITQDKKGKIKIAASL